MQKMIIILFLLFGGLLYAKPARADVTYVKVNKVGNFYSFYVTIHSNETGCSQFANWWEVLDANGNLLYRRILVHSHPSEQPFTRAGGKVALKKNQIVYIRAHLNNLGYVGDVFVGSVATGFKKAQNPPKFPKEIEQLPPQPIGCAF